MSNSSIRSIPGKVPQPSSLTHVIFALGLLGYSQSIPAFLQRAAEIDRDVYTEEPCPGCKAKGLTYHSFCHEESQRYLGVVYCGRCQRIWEA